MKIADSYKKINKMINNASSVYVMGHKGLDLDAMGACLGMYQYASKFISGILDGFLHYYYKQKRFRQKFEHK